MIVPVVSGTGVDSLGAAAPHEQSCRKTLSQSLQGKINGGLMGDPFWRLARGLACDVC